MQLWQELGRWRSGNGSQIREESWVCLEPSMGGQARGSTSGSCIGGAHGGAFGKLLPLGVHSFVSDCRPGAIAGHGGQQSGRRTNCRSEKPEGRPCLWPWPYLTVFTLLLLHSKFLYRFLYFVHRNLEQSREGYFGEASFASLINLTLHNTAK